ncbi:hypothetical protein TorRG33x02_248020 [Trema orientale]|uniref:Putative plant transposon protein domain-containing protein n=1 Tax=Trema orientale TaxID=63057 RepID=A0A2P5DL83_TREOI|nr:hypothetical protein TorRG33x02_248020 [Trema orientale]
MGFFINCSNPKIPNHSQPKSLLLLLSVFVFVVPLFLQHPIMVNTRSGKKSKVLSSPKGKGKASSSSPPAKKQKSVVLPISEKSKPLSSEKVTDPEVLPTQGEETVPVATKENTEAAMTPVVTQLSSLEEISSQSIAVTPVATQPEKEPSDTNVTTPVATSLATPADHPSKKSSGQSSKQPAKTPKKATAAEKAKGVSIFTTPTPSYNIRNAFTPWYYTKNIAESMNVYGQCQFIPERNINPKTFLSIGVLNAIEDQEWNNTVFKNKGFMSRVVQEFYANITDGFDEPGSITYHKIFVRNHIYDFSPQIISDFLGVPLKPHDESDKEYDEDMVATELLGTKRTWPKEDVLQVTDLTLKYRGLHRIAMHNWRPTTHYPTIHFDSAVFLYDVGTGVPVNLGQLIFEQICELRNLKHPKKRLIFPSLIYGILSKQKTLMYDSEFLTAIPSNIVFKLKDKDPTEGELEATADVGTQGPAVAVPDVTTSADQAARLTRIEKLVAAIAKKLDVDMEDV